MKENQKSKNSYAAQRKYQDKYKFVRVRMDAERYEMCKKNAEMNGKSLSAWVNSCIDEKLFFI